MTNSKTNNSNGISINSEKNAIIINGKSYAVDMSKTVSLYRYLKHGKAPVIVAESRQSWALDAIDEVCKYDYWYYITRDAVKMNIEMFSENENFDEEAYRNAHDRDGIYFDNEFVFNPFIDNSVSVTDVTDTTFYNNLIELIEDNSNNENLLDAVKNFLFIF